jgi:hypothetical protein
MQAAGGAASTLCSRLHETLPRKDAADLMLADESSAVITERDLLDCSPVELCACPERDCAAPEDRSGLSTDYLNHYSEILMMIEMASFDGDVVEELGTWQPIGYREYFLKSPLRRAPSAIAAYDRLPADQRTAFEQNVQALDKLAQAAILALQPPCHHKNVVLIGAVIGPAIRRQIDRAAAFLNNGCAMTPDDDETQAIIDRLIA